MFQRTRKAVYDQSHHEQWPYVYDGLLSDDFYFSGKGATPSPDTPSVTPGPAPSPQVVVPPIQVVTKVNPVDGATMVYVPGGKFFMGGPVSNKENPLHVVDVSGFWIGQNLVTVGQFRKFCEATGRSMPPAPHWGWHDDQPMVNVHLLGAIAYCKWAGGRLPTEAEWEKAARGTDGRHFPWGNIWDPSLCAHNISNEHAALPTTPVGSFPKGASPYGALDMVGNVYQWCADVWDANYWTMPQSQRADPINIRIGDIAARVRRGGFWSGEKPFYFSCTCRDWVRANYAGEKMGFRCVIPDAQGR